MIVDYTLKTLNEEGENRPELKRRVPNVPAELEGKVTPKYRSETDDFELIPTKEYKEELEKRALKRENQLLKERIANATDFAGLKTKIVKVNDSKDTPTKWADKIDLLEGEHIDHKGTIYEVLKDHTASKEAEPPQLELYKEI